MLTTIGGYRNQTDLSECSFFFFSVPRYYKVALSCFPGKIRLQKTCAAKTRSIQISLSFFFASCFALSRLRGAFGFGCGTMRAETLCLIGLFGCGDRRAERIRVRIPESSNACSRTVIECFYLCEKNR